MAIPNATAMAMPAVDIPFELVELLLLLFVVVVVELEGDVDSGGNADGAAGVDA